MPKIEKEAFHKEHHSRNLGLISEEDQIKIDETRLLIAGCGVGSLIGISAARLGFENPPPSTASSTATSEVAVCRLGKPVRESCPPP